MELVIEGKCYFKFVVFLEGNISNVMIVCGIFDCFECDNEVICLVKIMLKWKLGKVGGKLVN